MGRSFKVSYHSAKFCCHRHFGGGGIMVLACRTNFVGHRHCGSGDNGFSLSHDFFNIT